MKWGLLLPCLGVLLRAACPLRICAFNIQTFGDNKADNEAIAKVIVKVSSAWAGLGNDAGRRRRGGNLMRHPA